LSVGGGEFYFDVYNVFLVCSSYLPSHATVSDPASSSWYDEKSVAIVNLVEMVVFHVPAMSLVGVNKGVFVEVVIGFN